ncbi:serine hydrolase domain-containing protein [Bacillus sp. DX4.1]|uniref:serine hydrolase domain-containing protein n=1 Tax=Bacillus sp. DX4.1 TaxID=3055867 RepID=UPI0025A0A26C|nr:serine hydrolase domain-containing protein [Bacillus sp. DX4.1]MDM5189029.1 serine hydrolase domain-containing protein [Bacillus sp. DX4.1]
MRKLYTRLFNRQNIPAFQFGIITLCLIFIISPVFAQQQETPSNMQGNIEKYMEETMEMFNIPGAAIAMVHNDEIIYSKGWGITGKNHNPVTKDTPFLIGSNSKAFTALGIMKLVDQKKLELDEPVQTYLPWFTLKDKKLASQITIKQLLTQTSGLSTEIGLSLSDKGIQEKDAIKKNVMQLSDVELVSFPGQSHHYSNANYMILGAIIEEVSGQSFANFMEQNIFRPLQMNHTAADYKRAERNGLTQGYQSWFGISKESTISFDNGGAPYGYIAASVNDMAHYMKALLNGNEMLPQDLMQQMFEPIVPVNKGNSYGFGWRISKMEDDRTLIWHAGSTPDHRSDVFLIPETKWGVVILTNKNHVLEEGRLTQVKHGILQIIQGKEPPTLVKPIVIERWIFIGVFVFLCFIFLLLLKRLFQNNKNNFKKSFWFLLGGSFIVLSLLFIPALLYSLSIPWHSLYVFAPDLAFLAIGVLVLLAINGVISIIIACKRQSVKMLF